MNDWVQHIYCLNCGAQLDETIRFCPRCGCKNPAARDLPPYQNPNPSAPNRPSADLFMHESDKAALTALKAIPGFTPLMRAFMSVWQERQFRILNMSSNIRLSENQLPQYYNMLPPICEKLGIEVPELYLTMDVRPNAYTYGETKPFITLTSGLLDVMPDELIPTVLAHECGHIACSHVLYTTIGRIVFSGAASIAGIFSGLGKLASYPIQVAYYYWKRCSELSADRAAAICDGDAEKTIAVCMRLAGFGKNNQADGNKELFMQQALEYKALVESSKWDKTLEFLMLKDCDHPFNAVRAFECSEWVNTEQFEQVMDIYGRN